ncbi:MAG TPA: TlpA disulfide reductase family protein [Rugosimonospora sp.]|nr:TlpA disulfide reductase family protein [Rugosimonospora sp.]
MRRVAVACAVLLALGGCSTGTGSAAPGTNTNRYVAGDGRTIEYPVAKRVAAPAVSGDTLGGGRFDLAAQRGRVVVVNFWAEWCAPCVLESSALESVHKSTQDSGVVFVGVNSRDEHDKALAFQTDRLTYPSLFDPAGRIALRFPDVASALPTTVVIDRQGRIAAAVHDAVTEAGLAGLVKQIAAEP